jgi:hemerythrin-like metal-binding protein
VPLIDWGPGLELGHAEMDGQHRELVHTINQLSDAMNAGQGREVIAQVLERLVEYARYHFAMEETLMGAHAYGDSAAHLREHAEFISMMAELQAKVRSLSVTVETLSFLRHWLFHHILVTDRALADALASRSR